MLQKIVRVVLEAPIDKSFDYLYQPTKVNDAIPEVGQLVAVPFGRRTVVGLVIGTGDSSDVPVEKLKAVAYCFHEIPPFDKAWMDLCRFVASYYHRTLGEVAINVLPKMIRQNKQKSIQKALKVIDEPAKGSEQQSEEAPELNEDQQQAVEAITAAEGFSTFLLYGVTGSGKTEVYLRAVADKLASSSDGQVLLMVPEINLTPQLEERIRSRFPHEHIALQHSGLTERERLRDWLAIMTGRARIILGTRLSVMTPAPKLRMIVVDEEHDPSYKQQEGVRYSARDLAVWRANYLKIPVVLGSATPSLESWYHAKSGRYRELALPERARENAAHPEVTLIDTSKDKQVDGLSQTLVDAIEKRIEKGEISLLFLNRRGFAPVIICNACGWMSTCHRCSAYMVFHKANRILRCHHCGLERRIPKVCPDCGNVDLQALGRGTQRIEENIRLRFPQARILRIDADSTSRKGALQEALDAIYRGDVDIVIGTQMIA
ncbi:MAG: primosomal protein N', partial [Oxalobacter sp.]|nr:primosomal protein N' [Oxalobacter sp.]